MQAELPRIMRDAPRYTVLAVGRYGQLEMIDHWTGQRGVMSNALKEWTPGAWIDSAGHTDGNLDPSDTWTEA